MTYQGREADITVPPEAPGVTFVPRDMSLVKLGAAIFIFGRGSPMAPCPRPAQFTGSADPLGRKPVQGGEVMPLVSKPQVTLPRAGLRHRRSQPCTDRIRCQGPRPAEHQGRILLMTAVGG